MSAHPYDFDMKPDPFDFGKITKFFERLAQLEADLRELESQKRALLATVASLQTVVHVLARTS